MCEHLPTVTETCSMCSCLRVRTCLCCYVYNVYINLCCLYLYEQRCAEVCVYVCRLFTACVQTCVTGQRSGRRHNVEATSDVFISSAIKFKAEQEPMDVSARKANVKGTDNPSARASELTEEWACFSTEILTFVMVNFRSCCFFKCCHCVSESCFNLIFAWKGLWKSKWRNSIIFIVTLCQDV